MYILKFKKKTYFIEYFLLGFFFGSHLLLQLLLNIIDIFFFILYFESGLYVSASSGTKGFTLKNCGFTTNDECPVAIGKHI